jgi:hypothetical protein
MFFFPSKSNIFGHSAQWHSAELHWPETVKSIVVIVTLKNHQLKHQKVDKIVGLVQV